jgi:hypothetical protein
MTIDQSTPERILVRGGPLDGAELTWSPEGPWFVHAHQWGYADSGERTEDGRRIFAAMPRCRRCGRPLWNPRSLRRGLGPECAARESACRR